MVKRLQIRCSPFLFSFKGNYDFSVVEMLVYFGNVPVFQTIGRASLCFVSYLGQLGFLIREILVSLTRGQRRKKQVVEQIAEIGARSQLVVCVTGAFTGAVLTAQTLFQFKLFGLETATGGLVSVAMLRELGPTITGLMLAGRVGSAMAAEIGTMKVSEQIDALRSMAVHPIDYLVTPRIVAMTISVPLLIAQSALLGILASYVVGVFVFKVEGAYWVENMLLYVDLTDITIATIKGLVFGLLIVVISCHQGLKASNGAVGVGRSTTDAMVFSSLAILVANFFLTLLMQIIFPASLFQ
jgi:phospholipid/cholesterol/gamma-HCH transport system permease protein